MTLIYELSRTCDVFLTNYLPSQRQKLKIDLEHIRAANPDIIYVRGSAFADKGRSATRAGSIRPRSVHAAARPSW